MAVRQLPFWRLPLALCLACCDVDLASAGSIQSAPVVLHSVDGEILFDFSADAEALAAKPTLVGLDVLWKVTPGAGTAQSQVVAGLAIPTFEMGDRLHSALDATLPADGAEPATFKTSLFDAAGLPIGPAVIEEFYHDGNDSIGATLFTSGEGAQQLAAFFEGGGTIEAALQLTTASVVSAPPPSQASGGPGAGSVPEPMSLAVWGAVGALALCRRKRRATSTAAR
jgi:hypothetical protein